jgi:hypothetical protein
MEFEIEGNQSNKDHYEQSESLQQVINNSLKQHKGAEYTKYDWITKPSFVFSCAILVIITRSNDEQAENRKDEKEILR